MKRGFLWTLALILSLPLANPVGAEEKRETFKVGVVTELSGDLATGGNVTKRGYDLWAQEVNARGGSTSKARNTRSNSITPMPNRNRPRARPRPNA